jgi:predicted DNA-binding transcriptional regulator AlpA
MNEDRKGLDTELWTIQECAQWTRLSSEAVRCRLKRGLFPKGTTIHIGRSIRFVSERVKAWLLQEIV